MRKLLKTKFNSRNVFKAINTWVVSVVRYSAAFIGRSRLQLEETDWRKKNLLTKNNRFHLKSNVDQLYLSRSEGGRALIGVQDTVNTAILRLRNYVRNIKERMLIAASAIEDNKDRKHQMGKKEEKGWKKNTVDTKTITWRMDQVKNR